MLKSLIDIQFKVLQRIIFPTIVFGMSVSCASLKQVVIAFDANEILRKSDIFVAHHTGFCLFDMEENKFISNHNADLLFTPASNTKLLTMYATMLNFSDSIPGMLFKKTDTTTWVQPVGDPSFLMEGFEYQSVFDFLKKQKSIAILLPSPLVPYCSGWAWDDYAYNYQVERSWWPIYGNQIGVSKVDSSISITPPFFKEFTALNGSIKEFSRERYFNVFSVDVDEDTVENRIPFIYSDELLLQLLKDTLHSIPLEFSSTELQNPDTLFSQHSDTVLSRMMKPSDNFLSEQLLVLCAWKNGFTEIEPYIESLKNNSLDFLDEMVWVDGSGLSRYNLISPLNQVKLLKSAYEQFGWERLTNILPSGGEGTLKELYLSDNPFIFAKTGTLSNNHNLSGFLITESGKRLIFSFMNNHYTRPTQEVKKAMEAFLLQIRESY